MKKTLTFGALAATALTLAACSGNSAPEPEAEPAATETAPAAEAAPADDAALQAATDGADGTDQNNNPVGPAAADAPADGEAAPAAE